MPQRRDPFLEAAIEEARRSLLEGGIPIGSALIRQGLLLGRGHNRRVQDQDPVTHAEIDCLRRVGRVENYRDCVLYSTLMPCYLCAGAVVQFGIKKVVAGESRNFAGAADFMRGHGVEVVDLDDVLCAEILQKFILKNPKLWNEDIGI